MTLPVASPLADIPVRRGREIVITLVELLREHRGALIALMHISHGRMDALRLSQDDYSLLQRYGALDHDGAIPDDVACVVRACVRFAHGEIQVLDDFVPPAWRLRGRR